MEKTKCPTCNRLFTRSTTAEKDSFPFCSPRCRDVDLGQWLTEGYKVPVQTERVAGEFLEDDPGSVYFTDPNDDTD